jgi:hypothetical protein
LCLPVEVFASHGNSVARRCVQFSLLNVGSETNDSQFARSMNSDAKKRGCSIDWEKRLQTDFLELWLG